MIDRLHVLVEQSLVVHEVSGGESWFRLLDTIRAFAAEQLTDSGERDEVGERLTDHLVERSRELDELGSQAATELPHYLLGSFPTIRWAIERTLERDEEANRANTLVAPLMWLEDVGYQGEAMEVIGAVIDRLARTDPGPWRWARHRQRAPTDRRLDRTRRPVGRGCGCGRRRRWRCVR